MSPRELWVLIQHLPQESWTQTWLRDNPSEDQQLSAPVAEQKFGPWSLDNYQLAALTDAVNAVRFVLARVNNKEYPAPDPMPRPGGARPQAPHPQAAGEALDAMKEALAFLDTLRAKRG